MGYIVAVRSNSLLKWEHYEVPKEVYTYIKQLENYINYPSESLLLEIYPNRFAFARSRRKYRSALVDLSDTTYYGLQHKQPEGTDHPKKAGSGEDE